MSSYVKQPSYIVSVTEYQPTVKRKTGVCVFPGLNLRPNTCSTHASLSTAKRINIWNNLDLPQRHYAQLLKKEKEVSKGIYGMI